MSYGPELVFKWSKTLEDFTTKRIQKIYGGDSWVIISFSSKVLLLISWGARNAGISFISQEEKTNLLQKTDKTAPLIATLKSHLSNSEFISSKHIKRDKILVFSFKKIVGAGFFSTKKLILEMIQNHANLILTEENCTIIEAAKHIHPADDSARTIVPGFKYRLPTQFSGIALEEWLDEPSSESIKEIKGLGRPLLNAISLLPLEQQKINLAYFYSIEESGIMKFQKINNYYTYFPQIIVNAIEISDLHSISREIVLNPLLVSKTNLRKKKIELHINNEIKRRQRQIADMNALLNEDNYKKIKNYANLILSNIWKIPVGSSEVLLENYYEVNGVIQEIVPLNPSLTAAQNANLYFKKYKKMLKRRERVEKLLCKVLIELENLNEDLLFTSLAEDNYALVAIENDLNINKKTIKNDKKPEKKTLPPHKRIMIDNYIIHIGLSAKGNRYVSFKYAKPNDLWFHAKDIPGAHVILRSSASSEPLNDETILKVCSSLAVYYSKAKGSNNVRVDYTLKKHVSSIRESVSGVTYRNFKSINIDSSFWERYFLENRLNLQEEY